MLHTVTMTYKIASQTSTLTSQGFTSHSTQNRSFWRHFPGQSLSLVWKKQNL